MRVVFVDTRVGGSVPVEMPAETDGRYLILHWEDTDIKLLVNEVLCVIREDDLK